MKFETLVTRYKNMGYKPQGLPQKLEVDAIAIWLYETYGVFIMVKPVTLLPKKEQGKFRGAFMFVYEKDNIFYCDNYFKLPYDAKFDAVRKIYKAIRSDYKIGYNPMDGIDVEL